jgi:hypothetical protein
MCSAESFKYCYLRETRFAQFKREEGRSTRWSSKQYEIERDSSSSWGQMAARTHMSIQSLRNLSRANMPLLRWNFRMSRVLRRDSTAFTKNANLVNIFGSLSSSCESSEKSNTCRFSQRWRHLRDTRLIVATEVLVGRNDSIWHRIESGKLLIISVWVVAMSPPSFSPFAFCRLKVDFFNAIAVLVNLTTVTSVLQFRFPVLSCNLKKNSTVSGDCNCLLPKPLFSWGCVGF